MLDINNIVITVNVEKVLTFLCRFFRVHSHDIPWNIYKCNTSTYKWAINGETEARIGLKTCDLFNIPSYRDRARVPSKLYFMKREQKVAPIRFYCSSYKRENSRRRIKRLICVYIQNYLDMHTFFLSLFKISWTISE